MSREPLSGTMRAAVVRELGAPLEIESLELPLAAHGDVLVRIEASGLCGSDIHAIRGNWDDKPMLPLTPGHEGIGEVVDTGPGVDQLHVGDRVGIGWLGGSCGRCEYCVTGREELCQQQVNPGFNVAGTLAEYALVRASHAVRIPEEIDAVEAAPLGCAGVATFKAVQHTGAGPADIVAVFGIGGLGHLALQYARIAGARVLAVDVIDEKLSVARELGAEWTVNASEEDPVAALGRLGGAHAAIVVAAASKPFEQALGSLRPGGTLVLVALPPRTDNAFELPIYNTVASGLRIVGSAGGTRDDTERVFALHAAGRTRVITQRRPLDSVNEAVADVEAGRVPGRMVMVP